MPSQVCGADVSIDEVSSDPSTAGVRAKAFLDRARLEAGRYGSDPWIFVRELLQNSRDAGATHVELLVSSEHGIERVICRDDGDGMSFEHARRYLFALYASSKEGNRQQAGKFGVGFWSILRFEPEFITIRSRPTKGSGWGLRLDGQLERATSIAPLERAGTEIILERTSGDGHLDDRVFDAVWQNARYLHRRGHPDEPLPITINGRPANADFKLPAPSSSFRRGSARGVVALGPAPRVELFSRGLRVRSAASLEDLIAPSGRHTSRMRVRFPELPGGLAPQALLESDKLELMLSRSDARDSRALTRLVRLAQQELERLIDQQLAHARPQPWYSRVFTRLGQLLYESMAFRIALGCLMGLVISLLLGWWLWGQTATNSPIPTSTASTTPITIPRVALPSVWDHPYQDLGRRYRGPKVDVLSPSNEEVVPIHYEPGTLALNFAALTLPELSDDGSPRLLPLPASLGPYQTTGCDEGCITIDLSILGTGQVSRIPVPTGYRVVTNSLTFEGQPIAIGTTTDGHPAIQLPARIRGTLQFQVGQAPDPSPAPPTRVVPGLPQELRRFAQRLRSKPTVDRVKATLQEVRKRVRYDRSQTLAQQHAQLVAEGTGFIERTLILEAGDCDLQNGLLVALLQASDVPSRLVVGYVGHGGFVQPWLHAWVEYRDTDGIWRVADASATAPASELRPVPTREPSETTSRAAPISPSSDERASTPTPVAAPPRPSTPVPSSTSATEPNPSRSLFTWLRYLDQRVPWIIRGLPLALLGFGLWPVLFNRTRRAIQLDQNADISALLRGVLQQPAAFGPASALFTRPLVPTIDGRAISLNQAQTLAGKGRLYQTEKHPFLARQASRATIIDVQRPEGRTVADALGAIDLDSWARWIGSSRDHALATEVNRIAAQRGEDWMVRVGHQIPGGLAVLDLTPLNVRVPGLPCRRLIFIDERNAWFEYAQTLATTAPLAAVFVVLDRVAERLDLPLEDRARLLNIGAKQALLESFSS